METLRNLQNFYLFTLRTTFAHFANSPSFVNRYEWFLVHHGAYFTSLVCVSSGRDNLQENSIDVVLGICIGNGLMSVKTTYFGRALHIGWNVPKNKIYFSY